MTDHNKLIDLNFFFLAKSPELREDDDDKQLSCSSTDIDEVRGGLREKKISHRSSITDRWTRGTSENVPRTFTTARGCDTWTKP